jgi:hypothetical protein
MNIILNETQNKLILREKFLNEQKHIISERWETLNEVEKQFTVSMLETLYPEKIKTLNEDWWNTIGDVVGIADPTGLVDFFNGLDYIRQGDYFFGMLSMVSVIPYVGDAVAKPIMFYSKTSRGIRGTNKAMKMVKNGDNINDAVKTLEATTKTSPLIAKFTDASIHWGGKLKEMVNKIPGGKLSSGFKKTINEWVDLFVNTAKKQKQAGKTIGTTIGGLSKNVKTLSPKEAENLLKTLKKTLSKEGKILRGYERTATNPTFFAKYVFPGLSVGWIRNRELTSLFRRTKLYAGFLDYLGVANFVGPEELSITMGDKDFQKKFGEYVNSKQGQQNWSDDMSQYGKQEQRTPPPPQQKQTTQEPPKTEDSLLSFGKQIFGF